MPPVSNSTLTQQTSDTLCYYFNSTNKIQLIRLWDGKKYSLEKIISLGARSLASCADAGSHRFPRQRVLFEAKPEEILEVHTNQKGEQILESIFACSSLKVKQSQPQLATI
ncbi:MAG: DUF1830 domain-containing protein [Cyanobacteria bacterium J06648_1]